MDLRFVPVDQFNYNEMKQLHIKDSQKGTVETVEECCKEAEQFALWRPTAIADGDQFIGFAMYGLWIDEGEDGRVWLDRFFIDERYQGKGYAKPVLKLLIQKIVDEYAYDKLYLSVYEMNQVAIRIYESLGFKFNGELDINKELIMVLDIEKNKKSLGKL